MYLASSFAWTFGEGWTFFSISGLISSSSSASPPSAASQKWSQSFWNSSEGPPAGSQSRRRRPGFALIRSNSLISSLFYGPLGNWFVSSLYRSGWSASSFRALTRSFAARAACFVRCAAFLGWWCLTSARKLKVVLTSHIVPSWSAIALAISGAKSLIWSSFFSWFQGPNAGWWGQYVGTY